jgi:orotidine-5'-phosphate decarboxylase
MAGGWGCPHEVNDKCVKLNNLPCDPGMKGCVLAGRFVFANEDKNRRLREKQARNKSDSEEADNSGMHP